MLEIRQKKVALYGGQSQMVLGVYTHTQKFAWFLAYRRTPGA